MIFLNSVSSVAALLFYLPGVCTHTDTKGKKIPEYSKIFEKNKIFNEHSVCLNGAHHLIYIQIRITWLCTQKTYFILANNIDERPAIPWKLAHNIYLFPLKYWWIASPWPWYLILHPPPFPLTPRPKRPDNVIYGVFSLLNYKISSFLFINFALDSTIFSWTWKML